MGNGIGGLDLPLCGCDAAGVAGLGVSEDEEGRDRFSGRLPVNEGNRCLGIDGEIGPPEAWTF